VDNHESNPRHAQAKLLTVPTNAYVRLEWDVRSAALEETIEKAMKGAQLAAADVDLIVNKFGIFGVSDVCIVARFAWLLG
jgi:hypothetical protein